LAHFFAFGNYCVIPKGKKTGVWNALRVPLLQFLVRPRFLHFVQLNTMKWRQMQWPCNSQFNSWRAFIAGKRRAWRREESSFQRADAKFCGLKIVAKPAAARFSSRRHPARAFSYNAP
jgi:hypothetical protein